MARRTPAGNKVRHQHTLLFDVAGEGKIKSVFGSIGKGAKNIANKIHGTAMAVGKVQLSIFLLRRAWAATFGAMINALITATKAAADFEEAMLDVSTLGNRTKEEMDSLTASAREMAAVFGTSTVDQAKALYETISAGARDSAEAVRVLNAANTLAIAGVTKTKTAVDGLTTVMNAFGVNMGANATPVADKFFRTVELGKTRVDLLASSIGLTASQAGQFGVSMDEMFGIMAAGTRTLGNTARTAVGLQNAITAIIKPSKKAREEAARIGLAWSQEALRAKGLVGILQDLQSNNKKTSKTLGVLFGNARGLRLATALLSDNLRGVKRDIEAVGNSSGAAAEAMQKQQGGLNRTMARLTAQVNLLIQAFGDFFAKSESIKAVLGGLTHIIRGLTNTAEQLQSVGVPAVKSFFTAIVVGVGAINPIIGSVTLALGALASKVGGLLVFLGKQEQTRQMTASKNQENYTKLVNRYIDRVTAQQKILREIAKEEAAGNKKRVRELKQRQISVEGLSKLKKMAIREGKAAGLTEAQVEHELIALRHERLGQYEKEITALNALRDTKITMGAEDAARREKERAKHREALDAAAAQQVVSFTAEISGPGFNVEELVMARKTLEEIKDNIHLYNIGLQQQQALLDSIAKLDKEIHERRSQSSVVEFPLEEAEDYLGKLRTVKGMVQSLTRQTISFVRQLAEGTASAGELIASLLIDIGTQLITTLIGMAITKFLTEKAIAAASIKAAAATAGATAAASVAAALGPGAIAYGMGISAGVNAAFQPQVIGLAEGGLVTGGIPGKDSVPAMLMPGELVLPKRVVDQLLHGGSSVNNTSRTVVISPKFQLQAFPSSAEQERYYRDSVQRVQKRMARLGRA